MTPTDAIARLLSIDPRSGKLLIGGIGVLAAVALILTWFAWDAKTTITLALVIIAAGAILSVVSYIVRDAAMRAVLGWALVGFVIVWPFSMLTATLWPNFGLPQAPCILRFWENCPDVQDEVASNQADQKDLPTIEEQTVASVAKIDAPITTDYSKYRVYLQFAGVIRREDMMALSNGLADAGWNTQNTRGGERLNAASGYNEVRYRNTEDKAAAEALAKSVTEAKIVDVEVVATRNRLVEDGQLEIWLSR